MARILDLISKHETTAFQLTEDEREKVLAAVKPAELALHKQGSSTAVFQEEIIALEAAAEQEPGEWVYQWALCFSYYHIKQYDKALRSAEYAFLLCLNDPRSCYALAMVLYTLTLARQTDAEDKEREQYLRARLRWAVQPTEDRDPDSSWASLRALDMTVERAAQRAVILFVRLLHLDVPEDIEAIARKNIKSLTEVFPELRMIEEQAHHLFSFQAPKSDVKLEELTEEETRKISAASQRALTVRTPAGDELAFIHEVISDIEAAAANEPTEWAYHWMLVDYYIRTRKFGKAFRAGEQALELRPNDPRSAYALATVLSKLALAPLEATSENRALDPQQQLSNLDVHFDELDAEAARVVLCLREMTTNQAAQLALVLYSQVLQPRVSPDDRRTVEREIAKLVRSFPHLGYKLPTHLCAQPMPGTYINSVSANRDALSFWSAYKWSLYAWLAVMTIGMLENIGSQSTNELIVTVALNVVLAIFLAFPVAFVLWTAARIVIR